MAIFNAYSYIPMVFKDPFMDSMVGDNFSQWSVGTTLALILVYDLSKKWYLIFAAAYFIIEELFIKLGIFKHNGWYRSIYTAIGFFVLCFIVKKWYHYMKHSPSKFIYYLTLFFASYPILGQINYYFWMSQKTIFTLRILSGFQRNNGINNQIYLVVLTCILILLHKWKANWIWKAASFFILLLVLFAIWMAGIVHSTAGWYIIAKLSEVAGGYLGVVLMDNFLKQKKP